MTRRAFDALLLVAAVAAGIYLRFHNLGGAALWLDEILHYDRATTAVHEPWWRWVIGFEPENGALFYGTQLMARMFSAAPEVAARLAPACIGVATIIVAWFAARRFGFAAVVFALLIATSPLHVYFSREGRPYALLMLGATCAIGLLERRRPAGWSAGVLAGALVITAATAAPLLLAMTITAAVAFALTRERAYRNAAAIIAIAIALVPLLYRGRSSPPPGMHAVQPRLFTEIAQSFSVAALDTSHPRASGYVVLILAVVGAVALLRRDRVAGVIVTGMFVLPLVISLAVLQLLGHWYAARYICAAIPAYLLLVAIGIVAITRFRVIAALLAAAIAFEAWPAAIAEPLRKLDWRVIAATVHAHSREGDVVLATNDWTTICLGFYLRQLPPRVRLANATGGVWAVSVHHPRWIVSGGYDATELRAWSCRYPVVLASPLEDFRLHYAGPFAELLAERATPADGRAFAARFAKPFTLDMGSESEPFLVRGFGAPEDIGGGHARWVIGGSGAIVVPRTQRLTIRALPLLGVQQTMHVGRSVIEMAPEWREYTVDVDAREDVNTLTIFFERAEAPSPRDRRPLSAMIDSISLGAAAPPPEAATHINAADSFFVPAAIARHERHKLDVRDPALVARLGFDPAATHNADLEELGNTLAYDSGCLDDAEFVRHAFAIIEQRRVEGVSATFFVHQLQRGLPRTELVRKILRARAVAD